MKKAILIEVAAVAVLLLLALLLNTTVPDLPATEPTGPVQPIPEQTQDTKEPEAPPVTWKTYPADRAVSAQQYFVFSPDIAAYAVISGTGTDRIYPASVTKLFTAYTALQYLEPDRSVTVGDAIELAYPGSSVAQLTQGNVLTVRQLIGAMLLPSGNDAAYVLAAEAGRVITGDSSLHSADAAQAFVERMNQLAEEAGMTGTHFVNPDGIHSDEHYTTFDDLVVMARLALESPSIADYAGMSQALVQLQDGTELQWHNTNALIDPDSAYYCPYALGLKTGQTPSAGSCLLSAFRYDGRTLIVGVFGCPDENSRFDDSLQLFNQVVGIE